MGWRPPCAESAGAPETPAGETAGPAAGAGAAAAETEPETDSFVPDGLEEKDYGGRVYTVLYRDEDEHLREITAEELTGDVINDAVFNRTLNIQKRFNMELGLLPAGPMLFDGATISDHPQKLAVADVIREKLFGLFRDELPHSIGVSVESIVHRPDGSVAVKGTIYVRRSNQKGIVLGEKGRTLRTARRQSEAELRELFDAPVECDLWIRVEPNWDENFFLLRQIGYC